MADSLAFRGPCHLRAFVGPLFPPLSSSFQKIQMNKTHILSSIMIALGICAVSQAATITLTNANFASGSGLIASTWTVVDGAGANSLPSNYWQGDGAVPGIPTAAIYIKSDGGNYIQQALNASDLGAVDATTFNSYTVGLDYGFRHDGTFNNSAAHTIRISLWNVTDNVEIAGSDLVIAAPATQGSNSLTNGSFVLNYDNTTGSFAGDAIAIRFTSSSPDLGGNAWHRTAILDNVSIAAVPEPSASVLLGGLAVFALLRRRRA